MPPTKTGRDLYMGTGGVTTGDDPRHLSVVRKAPDRGFQPLDRLHFGIRNQVVTFHWLKIGFWDARSEDIFR